MDPGVSRGICAAGLTRETRNAESWGRGPRSAGSSVYPSNRFTPIILRLVRYSWFAICFDDGPDDLTEATAAKRTFGLLKRIRGWPVDDLVSWCSGGGG